MRLAVCPTGCPCPHPGFCGKGSVKQTSRADKQHPHGLYHECPCPWGSLPASCSLGFLIWKMGLGTLWKPKRSQVKLTAKTPGGFKYPTPHVFVRDWRFLFLGTPLGLAWPSTWGRGGTGLSG